MQLELDCRRSRENFSLDLTLHTDLTGAVGLFGPSGSGKTTLLRLLAGLDRADHGRIAWAGTPWQDSARRLFVPPQRRRVGLVFQDSRLFAHLDVQGNLDYPRRRCQGPIAYADVLTALDLAPLLRRRADSLSGGERQRVAIGRALLAQPALLLLDEPLSALDTARKDEILPYLQGLPKHFNVPLLYVSHDLEEIAALASRVLLLEGGRLRGEAESATLLARLTQRREAGVELEVQKEEGGNPRRYQLAGQALTLTPPEGRTSTDRLRLRVAARDVLLSLQPAGPGSQVLSLPAHFEVWQENGAHGVVARLRLDDGQCLLAELCPSVRDSLGLQPGQPVLALLRRLDLLP